MKSLLGKKRKGKNIEIKKPPEETKYLDAINITIDDNNYSDKYNQLEEEMKILKNNVMNYEIEKNKKNKELNKLKEEFEKYKKDKEKEINELKRKIEKYEKELGKINNNSQKTKNTDEQNLSLMRLKSNYEKPFINSILQCLIQTKQLSDYFLNNLNCFNNNNNKQLLSYKYYEIFQNINNKNFEPFDTNIFINDNNNKIENPKDFLLNFLSVLHTELTINDNYFNMNQMSKSIITDIFQGISRIKKNCRCCGFNYFMDEPFKYISLDEKDFSSISKNEININEIYMNWKKKKNSNSNIYYTYCQNCNNWTCDENFSVYEFPNNLILILERNENIKINFDEIFNLSYLDNENVNNFYSYYKLYGVVTKIKKEEHYIASCVNYKDNLWYKFDDDEISPIKDVKSEVINYEMPLILFYSKDTL